MGDSLYNPGQLTARQHERDNCVHYPDCLEKAAKGKKLKRYSTGGDKSIPCKDCKRFANAEPEGASAWAKRGDYEP